MILVFDRGRSHAVPLQALSGFQGLFQSDDFSAYETLVKKLAGVRRAGCAAHSRRKFYEAALQADRQGIWFIGRFRELYRIEDEVRDMSPEQRQAIRTAKAPSLWAEMKARAEQLQPLVLPQSLLGKAMRYFLHEYEALLIYLERPDYQIDNNLVENVMLRSTLCFLSRDARNAEKSEITVISRRICRTSLGITARVGGWLRHCVGLRGGGGLKHIWAGTTFRDHRCSSFWPVASSACVVRPVTYVVPDKNGRSLKAIESRTSGDRREFRQLPTTASHI